MQDKLTHPCHTCYFRTDRHYEDPTLTIAGLRRIFDGIARGAFFQCHSTYITPTAQTLSDGVRLDPLAPTESDQVPWCLGVRVVCARSGIHHPTEPYTIPDNPSLPLFRNINAMLAHWRRWYEPEATEDSADAR